MYAFFIPLIIPYFVILFEVNLSFLFLYYLFFGWVQNLFISFKDFLSIQQIVQLFSKSNSIFVSFIKLFLPFSYFLFIFMLILSGKRIYLSSILFIYYIYFLHHHNSDSYLNLILKFHMLCISQHSCKLVLMN